MENIDWTKRRFLYKLKEALFDKFLTNDERCERLL